MAAEKLLMYPSGYKALKLYSQIPTNGTGDFGVSRPSVATRINKLGLIETMLANVPRLDYTDGVCPVLLVEPQSTNLIERSETFSNAYWVKGETDLVSNSIISPDGTLNASKITATSTSASSIRTHTMSLSIGVTYTASLFVKAGTSDIIRIGHITSGSTAVWFDLTNGIVLTENGTSIGNIKYIGNGWYKCSNTFTATSSSTDTSLFYANSDSDGSTTTISGSNMYIFGAQLEEQSYATSYIKSDSGSSTTRLADVVTVTPPVGTTSIVETIDDVDQTPIIIIPGTFTVSEGNINKIKMT